MGGGDLPYNNGENVGLSIGSFSTTAPIGRVSSTSFRDLMSVERARILQFLSQQQVDPGLRCLSPGFSFRVSMARFSALPEGRQQQILQAMDSEATSEETPDPGYVDDVYPRYERSLSDVSGGGLSSPSCNAGPNSGGELHSSGPNSGGELHSSRPSPGGENNVWEIGGDSPLVPS